MEQKEAVLLLTTLHCIQETKESGHDEVYMLIYGDGKFIGRYLTGSSGYSMHSDDAASVDVEIKCTYLEEIEIEFWECDNYDDNDEPDVEDDYIGTAYIKRDDEWDEDDSGSRTVIRDDDPGEYKIDFRIISDPIPTVRLLGVYCEAQSAGMNVNLVEAIASVAEECTEAAGKVLKKSPRPSRKLLGDAFIAASKVLKGVVEFAEWIAGLIEGDDDVYMKHIAETETRGVGGSFFPPDEEVYKMTEGTEIHFEEEYGEYFRFPLDTGPVTIELREYDAAKYDIVVGSIIIDPEQISKNTSDGIDGGSPPTDEDVEAIEGGTAIFEGPAVVEIANSYYGRHDGEGAVYHICYSVGMEDWCQPATTEGQADPNDEEEPEEVHGYFKTPRGPVDFNTAKEECKDKDGVLPSVEEMRELIAQGMIPDSWPRGSYWLEDQYFIDIETGIFNMTQDDSETYFYSCKKSDKEDGIEGWDGVYGFTFKSPKGLVDYSEAKDGCENKEGKLPSAENMQQLIEEEKIPESWPEGPYWVSGKSYIDLPKGDVTESKDGDELCFYTCQIEGLDDDKIEEWKGIGGLYTFPMEAEDFDAATEGVGFQSGKLPSIEQLRVLIQQKMIPDSWATDGHYWTSDERWIDIEDIYHDGNSEDKDRYYYTCLIEALEDDVEALKNIKDEENLYTPPLKPLSHSEATDICETRGGELPTLEALRLLIEKDKIPNDWPEDAYYYTIEKYMVNINPTGSSDDIVMSADGNQLCYYSCELEPEDEKEVHGFFTAPQYVVGLDSANRGCKDQDGVLPALEEFLLLIEQGRIPDSWPKGEYWAGASENTPFRVNIEDGSYTYSTNGNSLCYYSCKIEDEDDGVAEWEPGEGYFTFPPEEQLDFEDAIKACEEMGGELPSLEQMQTMIKEGRIPDTWPTDDYYITSDNRAVYITDWESDEYPETPCYYTCKLSGDINGIEAGDEVEKGGCVYTHPQGPVNHNHAMDGSFYQGGTLPNLEELRLLVEKENIPDTWPTDYLYYTREKYMIQIDTMTDIEYSEDGSEKCYYTCKIEKDEPDEEVHGFFKSPLLRVEWSDVMEYCKAQGGELPTLEEMLLLIEQGRIPKTWPTDCSYWAGASKETLIKVDIKTGMYYHSDDWYLYDEGSYYSCKIAEDDDGVEEWVGVEAFYMLPGESSDYSTVEQACLDQGGKLPSVEALRKLIRQDKIPDTWPTGYYWASGSYYLNIADGTFKYSSSGSESCYYTCRIAGMSGVAQGDEVEVDGTLYMSPEGPIERHDARIFCDYQGGEIPTLEEMQYLIDEGLVPDTWPTDEPYLTKDSYWVNITDSSDTEHDSDGLVSGYYSCRVVLGQQEEDSN